MPICLSKESPKIFTLQRQDESDGIRIPGWILFAERWATWSMATTSSTAGRFSQAA
jgi:hypothetical protein